MFRRTRSIRSTTHVTRQRRALLALGATLASVVVMSTAPGVTHADPPSEDRVYYQRYSGSLFTPCPSDRRYQTNYSCVSGDNSESWARLYSAKADGSDEQPIELHCTGTNAHWLAPWGQLTKVVVDDVNGKIYWENGFEPAIARANLDGSDCEYIANGGYYGKVTIALDDEGDYLYSVQNSTLRRVNVTTGTVENLTFSGLGSFTPSSYADIIVSGDKLYATLSSVASAGHILEVTLDTTTTTQAARLLVTGQAAGMAGVSVDAANGFIYWATGTSVRRAALADGSNPTTIASGSFNYVNVLPNAARLVMGTRGNTDATSTNLDGSSPTATSLRTASLMSVGAVEGAAAPQTVTWSPTTDLTVSDSPHVPAAATTDGDGAITYAVTAAGSTGCTVDASTGELTFSAPGDCTVQATAAATASFLVGTADATFHITADPTVELWLYLGQGDAVAGATVEVTATGLQPNSAVTVELHSTPVVIGSGAADSLGNFTLVVTLPTAIEPGAHVIVARATDAQGDPITASQPLLVDWTGAFVDTQDAGGYHAMQPHRVLDTRTGDPLVAGDVVAVDISSVVPSDASAVAATFTVTQPGADGYLTAFPCDATIPATSTVNVAAGATVANLAITEVDTDGEVCVVASTDSHLIVDVTGYFAEGGDLLVTQEPVRLVDTRKATALAAGETLHVALPDGTDASAAVVNVAAVDPEAEGYLTVFPCGDLPLASNVNFTAGRNASTHVFATLGAGELCVHTSAATHVIVDQFGRFGAGGEAAMTPLGPNRLLDTRTGGALEPGVEYQLDLSALPAPAGTVALNVTATDAAGAGHLTVYACGHTLPSVSNLNFTTGSPVANHVTAALGEDGGVCVQSSTELHLIIDIGGLYLTAW